MQLTSPVFLFLFFPLSLLPLPFCPPKHRKALLCILSIAFFFLANRQHPLALLQVGAVVLYMCLLSALPVRFPARLRCLLGVVPTVGFWLTMRLLAEYGEYVEYPIGLTMVTLGAVSLSIDRYRSDAPDREGPLGVMGYLLFFPTALLGPVLRYKQFLYLTEHVTPSRDTFTVGARLYMIGYVKRLALAAILLRTMQDMLAFASQVPLSLFALPVLLCISYALFYSFISGTVDMARGLMSIYGLTPLRDRAELLTTTSPHRMLYRSHLSLDRYLEDYVAAPLRARFPSKLGRVLAVGAVFLLTLFFYRTRPEVLLFGLPVLICSCLLLGHKRWERSRHGRILNVFFTVCSFVAVSLLTLSLTLQEPLAIFSMFASPFAEQDLFNIYYLIGAVPDISYLSFALIAGVLFLASRFYPLLERRLPERGRIAVSAVQTALLFVAFILTVLYFLPQFPGQADLRFFDFLV